MRSLTSEELNYLVFRYLQESGFTHSAFSLGYEAGMNKCNIDGDTVPTGALIKFVQKGLQYLEMEANLNNTDSELEEDFSFFKPLDLITKDVTELQQMLRERNRKDKDRDRDRDRDKEKERETVEDKDKEVEREHEREREREKIARQRERDWEREKIARQRERDWEREKIEREKERGREKRERGKGREKVEKETMDNVMTSTSQICDIPTSDVMILEGHNSEVCACAWSPMASLLASGSGDATARMWTIPECISRSGLHNAPSNVLVLKHVKGRTSEKNNGVATLDWNGEGTLLATGSFDGLARIWTANGELKSALSRHKRPIFSLKWNKKGNYLLTGSADRTAIVWDVKAEELKQQFEFHTGPILDVDWRNNVWLATSSTDSMIYVCKIGETRPVKTFAGHQGEVNCVKWDPTGSLLASCSDDFTAKIWSIKQDNFVHDLREHSKEIYTIRWSPTGAGTNNPNQQRILASASFDSTVKLWDVELGKMLCSLNGHRGPVYTVAFSPDGEYLASGSLDKSMHIWCLKERKIVKTYRGKGGIFEVCWNKEGNKIAACFANNTLCVLHFRM